MKRLPDPSIPHVESIRITPVVLTPLEVSTSLQLKATAHYSDRTEIDITSAATWTSSDTDVLTVTSSGLVTIVGPGTATVTADNDDDPYVEGSIQLTGAGDVPEPDWIVFRRTIVQPADGTDFFVELPSPLSNDDYSPDGEPVEADEFVGLMFPNDAADDRTTDQFRVRTTGLLEDGAVLEFTVLRG